MLINEGKLDYPQNDTDRYLIKQAAMSKKKFAKKRVKINDVIM